MNGVNGEAHHDDIKNVPSEVLEAELPFVQDEQVPLSEILSRVVQDIYAELITLADTLPSTSDANRKRLLADFVIKHKKQVVKTFAVVRWAKDAKDVQKCMNITAFLMNQNAQFMDAANAITLVKESYAAEKLRNHDLLTSLDVLTTGTYQRLPTGIKKLFVPPKRLSDEDIERTLKAFDHLLRYRLRMSEIVPVEMRTYAVSSGQVHFHAPSLFSASLSLRGSEDNAAWFLVDVEFDIKVGGDDTGVIAFPRSPTGITKQYIIEEADLRLAKYIVPPEPEQPQPPEPSKEGVQVASQPSARPTLPENVVDAPLVRLYNFMQMMSLSYQLEILHYQAQRMRSLGWADFLKVSFSKDRKTLTVTYWIRKPPPPRPNTAIARAKVPLQGGTIIISIEPKAPVSKATVSPTDTSKSKHPPGRSHKDRILHELGLGMKLKRQAMAAATSQPSPPASAPVEPPPRAGTRSARGSVAPSAAPSVAPSGSPEEPENLKVPSDEVDRLCLKVTWKPDVNALGFVTNPADFVEAYEISSNDIDFQNLLTRAIRRHSEAILKVFRKQLCEGPYRGVFANEDVVMCTDGENPALQILLCADELVLVTIDTRTGRFTLRDTGDLAAAGRGPKFAMVTEKINENPIMIIVAITTFRYNTIVESAEQKAIALGLQTYKQRNMSREELSKFGPQARAHLFIQLHNFPTHYLVLVVAEEDFKHALVSVKTVVENGTVSMVIEDIGWLDVKKVRGQVGVGLGMPPEDEKVGTGMKRKVGGEDVSGTVSEARKSGMKGNGVTKGSGSFRLESDVIRELYAYCCARVSHMKVEQQLKARGIPYKHVMPSATTSHAPPNGSGFQRGINDRLSWVHSSLASSVPVLCVQSKDILHGVPAAEAAMPNIRIVPINWWTERKCQVVTCVKLKYVQPPVGKNAGGSGSGQNTVIRPSKSVIYDTREAMVSFLSEDVNTCVDEFLDGWSRVSTIVVIAREVSQMAKAKEWDDVRLLSFDLQTVEFTYTTGYALSIGCINNQQNPMGGSYQLRFSRVMPDGSTGPGVSLHDDAAPFLKPLLRNGRLAGALAEMVEMLRDTLPLALELEKLIDGALPADKRKMDVFPKSCGWYRVLFGDLKHAIDFRLMKEKRVVIHDASYSVFDKDRKDQEKEKEKEKDRPGDIGVLQPIPDFREILCEVDPGRVSQSGAAIIDVGLVCSASVAGKIGLQVVKRVVEKLQL